MKFILFIKKNWILIAIIVLGLFLRLNKTQELFYYAHDQDLNGWIIKDVVVDHHIRLIGQMTSTHGVFIGPLFYYLLIPFYLLFNMNPIAGVYMVSIIAAFAIWSSYFIFSKIFNKQVGLVSALIYAVCPYMIFIDREVVPTMMLVPWSIWFFFNLYLILKGDQKKGFLLASILVALTWHINLGLLLITPLLLVALILSKKKIDWKALTISAFVFILLSLPLFLFEIRHGFSQTHSVIASFQSDESGMVSESSKIRKVYDVVTISVSRILWGTPAKVPYWVAPILIFVSGLWTYLKKKYDRKLLNILFIWFLVTVAFFSIYTKPVSEYYLNSLTLIWLMLMSVFVGDLISNKKTKIVGYLLITMFVALSIYRFFNYPRNQSGYIERREVVKYIKEDAEKHGYPCVAVSYIVTPGNDLGYRYLFWLENMHVEKPRGLAPVYSIVFPHSNVDRMDVTFGALGVINPDYERYSKKGIEKSCSGPNANITEPMIGYTE